MTAHEFRGLIVARLKKYERIENATTFELQAVCRELRALCEMLVKQEAMREVAEKMCRKYCDKVEACPNGCHECSLYDAVYRMVVAGEFNNEKDGK